jgi:hypothetical protein
MYASSSTVAWGDSAKDTTPRLSLYQQILLESADTKYESIKKVGEAVEVVVSVCADRFVVLKMEGIEPVALYTKLVETFGSAYAGRKIFQKEIVAKEGRVFITFLVSEYTFQVEPALPNYWNGTNPTLLTTTTGVGTSDGTSKPWYKKVSDYLGDLWIIFCRRWTMIWFSIINSKLDTNNCHKLHLHNTALLQKIEELESRVCDGQEWISVKKRLPEAIGLYLVHGGLAGEPRIQIAYFMNDKFTNNFRGYYTHWMPLPEPPAPPT